MSTPSFITQIPRTGGGGIAKPSPDSVYNTTGINLPGGDAEIYKTRTNADVHTFRSLKAGSGVTLTQGDNFITIDGGSTTTATSLAGDVDVYKEVVGGELRFRGLTAGDGVSLVENASDITLSVSDTGVAANTYDYLSVVSIDAKGRISSVGTFFDTSTGYDNIIIASGFDTIPDTGYYNFLAGTVLTNTYNTTFSGHDNFIWGYEAFENATTASHNVVMGSRALRAGTTTSNSIMMGNEAGLTLATGNYNIAFGSGAMRETADATSCIAIGQYALRYGAGFYNIGIGDNTLQATTASAIYNVAIGINAGVALTTGDYNFLVGLDAGASMTTGSRCLMIGDTAGRNVTTADYCIYMGYNAGGITGAAAASSGDYNVGLCRGALGTITSGSYNLAVGRLALSSITTTSWNVAYGSLAGNAGVGTGNTYMGHLAAQNITTGDYMTCIGYKAGFNAGNTVNNRCVFIGSDSGSTVGTADDKLEISTNGNILVSGDFATGEITTGGVTHQNFIQLSDMAAPSNPLDGQGRLYKKTGDDAIYWLPDSAGSEVNLVSSGGGTESLALTADSTTTTALNLAVESSFFTVADDGGGGTVAQMTLADGTSVGQKKTILCVSIATSPGDTGEVKVTNLLDAAGVAGTKSFQFGSAGETVPLIWNGSNWMIIGTGTALIAPTF